MNDSIIVKILEIISKMPIALQVVGITFIIFSVAFFTLKDFRFQIYSMFSNKYSKPDNHILLTQRYLMLVQIEKIVFEYEHKTWLFRTLLRTKFNVVFDFVEEFVCNNKWHKLNRVELIDELLKLTFKMKDEYEFKILDAYIKKYKNVGQQLYELVYLENKGFSSYHQKNIDMIISNIQKFYFVESFDNNEIMNSYLILIWVALDTAINDCVITFNNLNGRIRELIEKQTI